MKKVVVVLTVIALLFVFTACSNSTQGKSPETSQATESTTPVDTTGGETSTKEALKVAMVCSGSLGDTGIFDMGNEGLMKAKKDFGIEYKVLEGKNDPSLYYDLLKTAAQGFDIVFVNPGYQFDSYLEEMADAFPDTFFVYADGTSSVERNNIISVSYKENEGSYLAGVMAAMMTKRDDLAGINPEKILGFVGAMDMPTINNFLTGFEAGVASVDDTIEVKALYVGDFNDPAKGKELALSLFDQGADIIYQAAATSGDGVTEAAKEKGMYTIGVDTDKSPLAPENVMGSMLKNVAISFYDVVQKYVNGEELAVNQREGLEKKWVEMYFNDYMKAFLPEDVMQAITDAESKIITGGIVIPEVK